MPPTAVTAHGYVHPLQWNIGRVHRYTERGVRPNASALPRAFRYAPRCEYTTPFGFPVVPDV